MVYCEVLIKNKVDPSSPSERVELGLLRQPALTETCRLIAREALPYYFRHEKFAFTVQVDRRGHVYSLYNSETEQWLKRSGTRDLRIHDITFHVAWPHFSSPSCQTVHNGLPCGAREYFVFLSVVGKSGIQVPFTKKDGYSLLSSNADKHYYRTRLQNFFINHLAWQDIEKFTADGLTLRRVEHVASRIPHMARLFDWRSRRSWLDLFRGKDMDENVMQEMKNCAWDWCYVACEYRSEQLEEMAAREEGERKR